MIYSQILLDIIYHYDTMLDLHNYALSERNVSSISIPHPRKKSEFMYNLVSGVDISQKYWNNTIR